MKVVKLDDIPEEKPPTNDYAKKVFINNGEIPHLFTFAQATFQPGQKKIEHGHYGRYEVFLVEQGKVKIVFDGKKEIIAEKGSCIVTEPHETHEVSNPFPETLILTYFQTTI